MECTTPPRTPTRGLYAQYQMHDRAEQELLPQGEFDVPLIIGDAAFDARGAVDDGSSRSGLSGDVILVNGRPWPVMKVKRRIYRFRFLVASIPRSYRFQLAKTETRSPWSRPTVG